MIDSDGLKDVTAKRLSLLCVDDNFVARRLINGICEKCFKAFDCEVVDEPLTAMRRLSAKVYDVFVTDCYMPTMDGLQLIRKIRQGDCGADNREIPIILFTGDCGITNRRDERCSSLKSVFILGKPISPDSLTDGLISFGINPDFTEKYLCDRSRRGINVNLQSQPAGS